MLRRLFSRRRVRAAPVSLVLGTRRDCRPCDERKPERARARVAGRVGVEGRMTAADFALELERITGERPGSAAS